MAISVKSVIDKIAFEIGDVAYIEGQQKFPPRYYIQLINRSITDIYSWLMEKELYPSILSQNIDLVVNQQQYDISGNQGKTIRVYKDNQIDLEKKPYKYSFMYNFTSDPEYYFETLDKIGFIPTPNAIKTITRYYVPIVAFITGSIANESINYPDIFEPLIVITGCLASIAITPEKEKEWFTQKAGLLPLWQEREKELKRTILRYYEPIATPKNIFAD